MINPVGPSQFSNPHEQGLTCAQANSLRSQVTTMQRYVKEKNYNYGITVAKQTLSNLQSFNLSHTDPLEENLYKLIKDIQACLLGLDNMPPGQQDPSLVNQVKEDLASMNKALAPY